MVRNQIYLREDQDKQLKFLVATGSGNFSSLVREGVDLVIKEKKNKKINKKEELKRWNEFIGSIKTDFGGKSGQDLINDYYENDVV